MSKEDNLLVSATHSHVYVWNTVNMTLVNQIDDVADNEYTKRLVFIKRSKVLIGTDVANVAMYLVIFILRMESDQMEDTI